MNHHAKPSRPIARIAYFIAAFLALTACDAQQNEVATGPSPDGVDLRGSALGGDFELTSNTGEKVRWSDFDGDYRLIYFGFTSCPAICPTDVQTFSQGLAQFERTHPDLADRVQPIFVSVDPERDTVDALDQFVNAFHPRLIGLTGSQKEVDAVVTSFGGSANKMSPDENGWYDVAHTTLTYLFAPDGSPLGIIPTDKHAEGVAAELERWVR